MRRILQVLTVLVFISGCAAFAQEQSADSARALTPGEAGKKIASDSTIVVLDVRTPEEYSGKRGSQCDPRQGHIPGAKLVQLDLLFAGPGRPESPERIRELVGAPEGAEVVAYCHSGSRSALATLALRSAGYDASNYAGSWHEWSRHDELPLER